MTDFPHHTPRLLSEADAAADLAGVPRPTEAGQALPRPVSSEEARSMADELQYKAQRGLDPFQSELEQATAAIRTLVSERDALAGRVRELEAERDQALRNRDMWKGQCERQAETLGMYHAKSTGLERDGLRYRYMRDLRIEQTGIPGQPCIAMPNGMQSGYYLTEETADHAVDTSIAALSTTPESKP